AAPATSPSPSSSPPAPAETTSKRAVSRPKKPIRNDGADIFRKFALGGSDFDALDYVSQEELRLAAELRQVEEEDIADRDSESQRSRRPSSKRKTDGTAPKKKPHGRPKLTPRQKLIAEKRRQLRRLGELKAQALEPPRRLPETAQRLYLQDMKTNDFAQAHKSMALLSKEQLQSLEVRAAENRVRNTEIRAAWYASLTPLQVVQANSARRKLRRLLGAQRVWLLHDGRTVKRPLDAWKIFLTEKHTAGKLPGETVLQLSHRISAEYRALTPEQREKYEALAREDFERYTREYREVYGVDVPRGTGSKRKSVLRQAEEGKKAGKAQKAERGKSTEKAKKGASGDGKEIQAAQ
ncbi:hypothetical protein KEM52_005886, partial [Ascosphaera acerosa]